MLEAIMDADPQRKVAKLDRPGKASRRAAARKAKARLRARRCAMTPSGSHTEETAPINFAPER